MTRARVLLIALIVVAVVATLLVLSGCDDGDTSRAGPFPPESPPALEPLPLLVVTTQGDSLFSQGAVVVAAGEVRGVPVRMVIGDRRYGVIVGVEGAYCEDPVFELVTGRWLEPADAFTGWMADGCSVRGTFVEGPGAFDFLTHVRGIRPGRAEYRLQFEVVGDGPAFSGQSFRWVHRTAVEVVQ